MNKKSEEILKTNGVKKDGDSWSVGGSLYLEGTTKHTR